MNIQVWQLVTTLLLLLWVGSLFYFGSKRQYKTMLATAIFGLLIVLFPPVNFTEKREAASVNFNTTFETGERVESERVLYREKMEERISKQEEEKENNE